MKKPRLLHPIRNLLALVGAAWAIATFTPLTRWWTSLLMGAWNEPRSGALIVLGADEPTNNFIGIASYWRAYYAVQVWKEGGFERIVLSGGRGVAQSMADLLICSGVPRDRIVVEAGSESTRENAVETVRAVARLPGPKVLMTTDFHTFRSVRAFRKAGLEVTSRPVPYGIKRYNSLLDRWPLLWELAQETAKTGYYFLRGWI
jgi:uncharacterized SAM-binding protein YcdF (DUF218 family)